jgi:hypothetical protein
MSVVRVLGRMAELAENAGKHRTEEWLRACSVAYQAGEPLPAAPRYKGPLQDLDALTDDALVQLQRAIVTEQRKRLLSSRRVPPTWPS